MSISNLHRRLLKCSAAALCAACALVACGLGAAQTNERADAQSGMPTVGEIGIQTSTSELMARQAALAPPQTPRIRPVLRPDRSGLPQNPASSSLSSVAKISRGAARPKIAQTLSTTFTGATLTDTGAFPPDSMGAVGPTQFFVTVNGRFRTFNKATGVADGVLNIDPDIFFASVMTPLGGGVVSNFTSDPRVRYDRLSGRWLIEMIDVPNDNGNPLAVFANRSMLAVSDSATITGSTVWSYYFFTPGETAFLDYCTMGIDVNALYIGCNMFPTGTGAGFLHTNGYVVRKSSVLSGGPIVVTPFLNLTGGSSGAGPFTPQGVDNFDPAATEGYFIGVDNATFGTLMIRRITNPAGSPTISGNISLTVSATSFPINVPHLGNTGGTNGQLDGIDDRLFAAHLRNGRLWTAHNIAVNTSGVAASTGATRRDAARWYELQNLSSTPSVVQSGTLFDSTVSNPRFHWIPTIMVSGQGHAVMGYSEAGNSEHANAGFAGRLVGDPLGTLQVEVPYTGSAFAYNPPSDSGGASGRRWGDYSYTSVDPNDDMTMWTIQEYTDSTNVYGVRVAKLLAPPPATPASTSPSSIAAGQSSVVITLTGTSVGGSGFFDPGTGFPNRLQASISGGVTVNSVTYNNPTSIKLDVSTAAATAGAKNITVTDPDGQALTGIGILTVSNGSPGITSANNVTFTAGNAGTFTVTATGSPATFTFAESGALPAGVTFDTSTGVLAGTPASRTGGVYNMLITVSNGIAPDAMQSFTLTVNEAPAIVSTNTATFGQGVIGSFQVVAVGFPTAFTFGEAGGLPGGLGFDATTGVLSGAAAGGTAGRYSLTFSASNGVGAPAMQGFTLEVAAPLPVFTALTPCRVVDTRNAGGPISANTSRRFFFYNDSAGFSWSTQGGTAGSAASACPGTTLTSAGGTLGTAPPVAAVLTITVVNATAAGNFVVWGGGPPSSIPNASMLNWPGPGVVLANTGPVPAGGRGSVEDFEIRYNGPTGQADVVVDVVGYVLGNTATPLQCVIQVASGVGTHASASVFVLNMPACPTGYAAVNAGCSRTTALPANVYLQESAPLSGRCSWFNGSGGGITATEYTSERVCCRVPGQ